MLRVVLQQEGEDVGEGEWVVVFGHAPYLVGPCVFRKLQYSAAMTILGDYIRERRGDLDMTRAELARELKVHNAQVQRWEDGSQRPRPDTMQRLARALLIESSELWQLVGEDTEVR